MKILVVVDMQKDFITGALGNDECRAAVGNVVNLIKSGSYDTIFATLDTHTEDYLKTQEGSKLPVEHCIIGTDGHTLDDNVEQALGEVSAKVKIEYVEKETFGSPELGMAIGHLYKYAKLSGDSLTIDFCGVCTGICVISNVLIAKANAPEASIEVVENACACVTPQSHNTAIEAMKMCQIDII